MKTETLPSRRAAFPLASGVRLGAFAALTLALGIPGCGSGPPMAEVSGTVTFEGKKVDKGSVSFFPLNGKGAPAGGYIENGVYTAEVPYGEMRVKINGQKFSRKRKLYDRPDSPEMDIFVELIPERYNNDSSELKLTVDQRRITKDFDLKK
jgi:hypothetical protein